MKSYTTDRKKFLKRNSKGRQSMGHFDKTEEAIREELQTQWEVCRYNERGKSLVIVFPAETDDYERDAPL